MSESAAEETSARLDKWLWAVRVFKTRPLATEACRGGSVTINELNTKPAREVHAGETVIVRQGLVIRTLKVVGVPRSRVGAKLVTDFCAELTPASEWEKAKVNRIQQVLARGQGSGRPTKRDRRAIDRLFD